MSILWEENGGIFHAQFLSVVVINGEQGIVDYDDYISKLEPGVYYVKIYRWNKKTENYYVEHYLEIQEGATHLNTSIGHAVFRKAARVYGVKMHRTPPTTWDDLA